MPALEERPYRHADTGDDSGDRPLVDASDNDIEYRRSGVKISVTDAPLNSANVDDSGNMNRSRAANAKRTPAERA